MTESPGRLRSPLNGAMTKKNRPERAPEVSTGKVEHAADRLHIPRDTEEGRLARRTLHCLPIIIAEFHRRRCDRKARLTPRQELDRHEQFRRAVNSMLAELEDGGWAHRTLREKARDLAWMRGKGSEYATDVAARGLDEEFAMGRALLTKWRDSSESSKRVMKILGPDAKARSTGSSHWLARVSLLIHKEWLSSLKPKISERQFLDLIFELANVERGHDVAYHLRKGRAALRHPAGREFTLIELGLLGVELEKPGSDPKRRPQRQKRDGENRT
jgi:hypothetical protein